MSEGFETRTDLSDLYETPSEEHMAHRERDRLWCKALIEVLNDTRDIEAVVHRFNQLRSD